MNPKYKKGDDVWYKHPTVEQIERNGATFKRQGFEKRQGTIEECFFNKIWYFKIEGQPMWISDDEIIVFPEVT